MTIRWIKNAVHNLENKKFASTSKEIRNMGESEKLEYYNNRYEFFDFMFDDIFRQLTRLRNYYVGANKESDKFCLKDIVDGIDLSILIIWLNQAKATDRSLKDMIGNLPNHQKKGERQRPNTIEDFDNWDEC